MASTTDPARELAETCERLSSDSSARGDQFLASMFDVDPWSQDFYQIVFCIIGRIDSLIDVIGQIDIDDDFKEEAKTHLRAIKTAFDYDSLSNAWVSRGRSRLSRENIQPLKMLANEVRRKVSYPKLRDEDHTEIVTMIADLEEWLNEHRLRDNDFIRQALLDGVRQFRFRFERIGWLGWGYTIESLRDVIGAYLALEKGIAETNEQPDASATLSKVAVFLKAFYEKSNVVRDVYDTGEMIVKLYGLSYLTYQAGSISGLIGHMSK